VYTVEGNTSSAAGVVANGGAVAKKQYSLSYGRIAGYGRPKYDAEPAKKPATTTTSKPKVNAAVQAWQKAAIKDGFKFPKYGADGDWGTECENVAKKAICRKYLIGYKNKNLTKIVQAAVGVKVDGYFGNDTKKAVIAYQKKKGLSADGVVGYNTWKKILGVK
jgi:peptidoglycan hydrolase-like protein with peptidoglycan-binding domain